MNEFVIFEDGDLREILAELAAIVDYKGTNKITIAIDGGLKIKVNEGGWSHPMGKIKGRS